MHEDVVEMANLFKSELELNPLCSKLNVECTRGIHFISYEIYNIELLTYITSHGKEIFLSTSNNETPTENNSRVFLGLTTTLDFVKNYTKHILTNLDKQKVREKKIEYILN